MIRAAGGLPPHGTDKKEKEKNGMNTEELKNEAKETSVKEAYETPETEIVELEMSDTICDGSIEHLPGQGEWEVE